MSADNICIRIVGIGASAGGFAALQKLVETIPPNINTALVFVQHLLPSHKSLLFSLLHSQFPDLKIQEIDTVTRPFPGVLYLKAPDSDLVIENGRLKPVPAAADIPHFPIDRFLFSLAQECREKAIAVILSGTGTDGARGAQMIRSMGGTVIVQNPATAEYSAMPHAVIRSGQVDKVLEVERIIPEIMKLDRTHSTGPADIDGLVQPSHFDALFHLIHEKTGYWFNYYKRNVVTRRLQRRLSLHGFSTVEEYVALLMENNDEAFAFAEDLMIGVTAFFRDRDAWEVLKSEVLLPLIARRKNNESIRVWTPACASGEESYSIAMMLHAEMEKTQQHSNIQIFATDINENALIQARTGIYPESISADVPPQFLHSFFTRTEDTCSFMINKEIREHVVFARQNILTDPPFSRLDLIICRNLLIYLEPQAQEKCLDIFHYSLKSGGYLFLGNAETTGSRSQFYKQVAGTYARIYQKGEDVKPVRIPIHIGFQAERVAKEIPRTKIVPNKISAAERAQEALLEHFIPAAVGIDAQFEIFYRNGPTHRYLAHPRGPETNNLLDHLPEILRPRIRSALYKAQQQNILVPLQATLSVNGKPRVVGITLWRFDPVNDLLIVTFRERKKSTATKQPAESRHFEETALRQLEHKLSATREDNQRNVEQLKSLNEELQSSNEELQAANEELETSREELQSLNEELITVNAQLQTKIAEVESVNNDLTNFLSSTNIPTIFLDEQFKVRRFTPAMTRLIGLIPSDIGRLLTDFSQQHLGPDLIADAHAVLQNLMPIKKEIAVNSLWYIRTVQPYRTLDNRIKGSIVTYIDITDRKKLEIQLGRERELLQTILDTIPVMLAIYDPDINVLHLNKAVQRITGWTPDDTQKTSIMELAYPDPQYRREIQAYMDSLTPEFKDIHMVTKSGKTIETSWANVKIPNDGRRVGIGVDISQRKQAEQEREQLLNDNVSQRQFLETLIANIPVGIAVVAGRKYRYELINQFYRQIPGTPDVPMIGKTVEEVFPAVAAQGGNAVLDKVYETKAAASLKEYKAQIQGREETYWNVDHIPLYNAAGEIDRILILAVEITDLVRGRKEIEQARNDAEQRAREAEEGKRTLETLMENVPEGITLAESPNVKIRMVSRYGQHLLGAPHAGLTASKVAHRWSVYYPDGKTPMPDDELPLVRAAKYGEVLQNVELVQTNEKGHQLYLSCNAAPIRNAENKIIGAIVAWHDISERKRMEEQLRQHSENLAAANRELESFSSSVSHDLRAPLRTIRNFAQFLLEDYYAQFDEAGQDYLRRIVRGADKMNELIDDMLSLSRVSRQEMVVKEVNLSAMGNAIIKELRQQQSVQNMDITIHDNLKTHGDERLLNIALTNLLSNALKYTSKTEKPFVEFGSYRQGHETIYYIRDNGAGFSMDQTEKLFLPFQRLHSESQFPGTGIGLPIVERVIKRHGGKIWAEGEKDKGAVFYFTIHSTQDNSSTP